MEHRYYVGTYTEESGGTRSRGIYSVKFDGKFGLPELEAELPNPSFLARHPVLPMIYSVSELTVREFGCGGLYAYHVDEKTGRLRRIGGYGTNGLAPCHVAVEPQGRFLVVSNYRTGNFAAFVQNEQGIPHGIPVLFQGAGRGPNAARQDGPHAHSTVFAPSDGPLFMLDLGSDTIYVRHFNPEERRFESSLFKEDLRVSAGSGCRHAAFSPDGLFFHVVNELSSSLSVFRRNPAGNWEGPIQTVSTLPSGVRPENNSAAAIGISPCGRLLFVSNRGHGSVALFKRDMRSGGVDLKTQYRTKCKMPRFCSFDRSGEFLLVCGQDIHSIEALAVDYQSFSLLPTGEMVKIGSPACMI